jgi:hypothetical protein
MRFVKSILSDIEARGQIEARSSIFKRAQAGPDTKMQQANKAIINLGIDL